MKRPLAGLSRQNLLRELLAGVTLIALAIPLNIGYAQIAGLPATAGLYALVVPTVIYALTVSSRQVVASPDAAAAALVASSVGGLAAAGAGDYATLALAQAIIGGLLFLLLAFFRLGFLANFLSKPILIGFIGGLALNILVSQVAKMLGIPMDSGAEFIDKVFALIGGLGEISWISTAIAAGSVAVLVVGQRLLRIVPWALVVLIVTTSLVVMADLEDKGVSVLGEVAAGAPALTWPVLDLSTWVALVPSAIALTMVTMSQALLLSRSYGEQNGYRTEPNRDLFALGLANIGAGLQGSFSIGASASRTAAMDQHGSRTQLPSLVLAAGTLVLLVFGTALLSPMPSPAIGAIVAVAILPLLGFREFSVLWRLDRFEFAIAAVCFAVTLLVGSIAGILIAFVLALVNLARRAASPPIDVLAADDDPARSLLDAAAAGTVTAPGIVVIRMSAPFFFANSAVFTEAVRTAVLSLPSGEVRHVVLDLEAVTDADVTAAEAFSTLRRWLADRQVSLAFSRVRPAVDARLRHLGIIAGEPIFPTNRSAVAALRGNQPGHAT